LHFLEINNMKRSVSALEERVFDVLIIGGGIFGACAAWDATLRGLSVALVERTDFAAGTSANSYKFVHGGIRYLQHADLPRLRRSCRERSALLRVAPHLVSPIPVVIPTYGNGRKGKPLLGAGMLLYDALTLDRNIGIADPKQRIPLSRFMDAGTVRNMFPGIVSEGLTGAAVFCDGQMYNPTRLVLAFIRSAVENGAIAANYVEAEKLVLNDGAVQGATVKDHLTGEAFEIRARTVLNAAGPWAPWIVSAIDGRGASSAVGRASSFSRDACIVIRRRFPHHYAIALQGQTHDPDALISRSARHVFLAPWRNYTLCGVWHRLWTEHPDGVRVTDEEIDGFLAEVNAAMPGLELKPSDVTMWNAGVVPFGDNDADAKHLSYGKRSHVIDHSETHAIDNLVSLIGVRYTMARGDASRAVDTLCGKLEQKFGFAPTDRMPVHGGDFERFDALVQMVERYGAEKIGYDAAVALAHNYGTAYKDVLRAGADAGVGAGCLPGSTTLRAEIVHAVRDEMAVRFSDIVFRRTDIATGGHPGPAALQEAATIAARELGWDDQRRREEIAYVESRFIVGNTMDAARPSATREPYDALAGAGV
jgi:glycerol-3-phosphate dehydrogenase